MLLLNATFAHEHHAIGHGERFILIMRDEHHRHAQAALQATNLLPQAQPNLCI